MTTTLGTASLTTRREPALLCVLVGAAVVVGWVLYRHYAFPHVTDRVLRWNVFGGRLWLLNLVQALLLCAPYALVLLLWGRGLGRAAAGAVVALSAGVYLWALDEVFQNDVWRSGSASTTSVRVFDWADLLGIAVLVPLAWGVARRERAWFVGLVVGPVAAAVVRELQLRWTWWQVNVEYARQSGSWVLQAVTYVGPFVLAVLACWALEARSRRTPDIGSSASSEAVQPRRSRG